MLKDQKLIIGLTGGIASGKSSVSQLFASQGIDIIDADKIARDLFQPAAPLLMDLREQFGDSIFSENGQLNRKALAAIVFKDPKALLWLNKLTHPKIRNEIIAAIAKATSNYVILDIPLLINKNGEVSSQFAKLVDRILVIDLKLDTQLQRLHNREAISQQQALNIIENQSSREQKLEHADDIIDNNSSPERLAEQVLMLHNNYTKLCHHQK